MSGGKVVHEKVDDFVNHFGMGGRWSLLSRCGSYCYVLLRVGFLLIMDGVVIYVSSVNTTTRTLPPLEELEEHLKLDPVTGNLHWAKRGQGRRVNGLAGVYGAADAYVRVMLKGETWLAHRIVWKMFYREEPPEILDHINRVKCDNRPVNLRGATAWENFANSGLAKHNTSGVKGVSWNGNRNGNGKGRWVAKCEARGKIMSKAFKDFDKACEAVRAMRELLHGEFANHG